MSESVTDPAARLASALADRYRIERELGAGGMATVYLAEDPRHKRKVAVKVLKPELAAALGAERFLREIQIAAQLHHPHILPLYDSGEADGFLYYVMPYAPGPSLRERLTREGELPASDVIRLLRDVVDALAYAHRHGVVHRDIKPDNVMLADRHALVMDFGVAKAVSEASGATGSTTAGMALGTPAYMSPEQAAADPHVDHRTDIYAVGVMAYEMLAGQPPFTGATPQSVLAAHVTQAPEHVSARRPSVPPALAALVMRCLEKRPADRWQSAEELLAALELQATSSASVTPTESIPVRRIAPRWSWGIAGVAVAALVIAGFFGTRELRRSPAAALDENLIAIFPFRVTSADASLNYLSEGMVDLLSAMFTGEGGPRAIDPRTALAAWNRQQDAHNVEAAAPAAARDLGAGEYLVGSVVGTGGRLVLSASVGRPGESGTVVQARVEGPIDSLSILLDELVGQLLVRTAGVTGDRAIGLSSSLEAIRSYVAGRAANRRGDWDGGALHFARAIALDSSFTLAALGLTESSTWMIAPVPGIERVQALAWANRARLSPRDQAVLAGYTGGNGPAPNTGGDELRAWETAVSRFPDMADAWYWLGETYFHLGGMLGREDHLARARQAFEMASSLDPEMVAPLYHRIDMAATRRDTTQARALLAQMVARDSSAATRSILELYVAEGVGDSADVAAALGRLERTGHITVYWATAYFLRVGRGMQLLDTIMNLAARTAGTAVERDRVDRDRLATLLDLGRPDEALAHGRRSGVWDDTTAMEAALYREAPRTAAFDAVQRQSGSALAPAAPTTQGRQAQYAAACLMGQWNLLQEPARSAAPFIAVLRRGVIAHDATSSPEANPVCLSLLEAMQAIHEGRPDRVALVVRLDTLVQTVPPGISGMHDAPDAGLDAVNLLTARLLHRVGLIAPALRAVQRKASTGFHDPTAPTAREAGRLAALAGDRQKAETAYRHYLALRWNPEPSMIPQRDSVMTELAALEIKR